MVETPLVYVCSKCIATFNSSDAFEQHNSIAQLFDGICQPVPVREKKFSGPAMFFIPYFAWQFLEKVGNDLGHSIFYLDSNRKVVPNFPLLENNDPGAQGRADLEKEGIEAYVNGDISLSQLLEGVLKRFLSLVQSGNVSKEFHMAPYFAYLPYILPPWKCDIMASFVGKGHCLSKNVIDKHKALREAVRKLVKDQAKMVR